MIYPEIDRDETIKSAKRRLEYLQLLYSMGIYKLRTEITAKNIDEIDFLENTNIPFETRFHQINIEILKAIRHLDSEMKYIICKHYIEGLSLSDIKYGDNCDYSISKVYEKLPEAVLHLAYLVRGLIVYRN